MLGARVDWMSGGDRAKQGSRRQNGSPTSSSGRAASILIVDDVEDSREMYAEYLRFKGYLVETATDGRHGLARALDMAPDTIVLDLTMPGIDGLEALRQLRRHSVTSHALLIVVTGHALKGTREQAMKAGADVFLTKPCLPDELEAAITAQHARRGSTPPRR